MASRRLFSVISYGFLFAVILGLWRSSSDQKIPECATKLLQQVGDISRGDTDTNAERHYESQDQSTTPRPTYNSPTVLAPCGEVCSYGGEVVRSAEQTKSGYPQLEKNIVCKNIMLRMAYKHHTTVNPPPRKPPTEFLDEFSMSGAVDISKYYFNEIGQRFKHTPAQVDQLMQKVHNHMMVNTYRREGTCVQDTIAKYANHVTGRHGVVIGTIQPWLEAILLANNASRVTTLEYNPLNIIHPQIEIYTPYQYADLYLQDKAPQFEFAATYSSLEHSGLGRYGDPINPYGDLEAMAQIWCMLKPGAMLAVGVPSGEKDKIEWNAHRIYGSQRLPQFTANWQVEEAVQCKGVHKFLVLIKPEN